MVDLDNYYCVTARTAFCLDGRNSAELCKFSSRYSTLIDIYLRKQSNDDECNPRSTLQILCLGALKGTDLDIIVTEKSKYGKEIANEIKKFLEDEKSSVKE